MKPAAMGMFITIVIVLIAVLDKYADNIPGANYMGVKSDFVEPGLWLNHPAATRPTPNVQRQTASPKVKSGPTTPQRSAGKAKTRLAKRQVTYPINVPY